MKKLLRYLTLYRKESVLAPLFKLLEAGMDLIVPLVVAQIINGGIAGADKGYVVKCFFFLILLAVLGIAFSFTAQWFAAKASVGFATDLRQDLFDHIQSLSFTELDTLGTDTLITRMTSDINQVQNGINLALRLLLRSPFIVFGAMIMAFTIDVRCALIFAVAIPILSVVVFWIMLKSIPLFAQVQKNLDSLLGKTRENLTGVRVIRAFCKEKEQVEDFDERNDLLTRISEKVGRLSALMNPATYLLINLAAIILIRQGAVRINSGAILQGDLVALYNYMAQIIIELVKLASLIITINKALACADRISDMMDINSSMEYADKMPAGQTSASDADRIPADRTAAASGNVPAAAANVSSTKGDLPAARGNASAAGDVPAVCFKDVSFSYAGSGEDAVEHISFSAGKGRTVGIIGGTGSGKSTVINLIPRFYDVREGEVLVNGINVKEYPETALTSMVGVVPQKAVLFEGTIRENLQWGKKDAGDDELWQALRTAQAEEIVKNKEGQLDARIEQGGRNLSGGQRQRLTIARALVRQPQILILDDSASALDFATDLKLRQAIRGLEGDMTVFIVSQRTSSVRYADLILVLDDGMLAGKGTHDELMADCPVYQEIYYSQFPEERPQDADPSSNPAADAGNAANASAGGGRPPIQGSGPSDSQKAGRSIHSQKINSLCAEGTV